MSEFFTQVVIIENVVTHPNADKLDICTVLGNYPVISKRGEYRIGDKAVYLSIDALVPLDDERWEFLRPTPADNTGYFRIKAKRLRGIFSMGILTPAYSSWEVGMNVKELLGIEKYEPEVKFHMQTDAEANPGFIPTYTDIDGYRKYSNLFQEGEEVVCLEKIHGANLRVVYKDGRLWVGSHHQIKKDMPGNVWWEVLRQNNYIDKFAMYPDYVFVGEVYGQVQDLKYGAKNGQLFFSIFDVWNITQHKYLDWPDVEQMASTMGIPTVPVLYSGPWKKELVSLAEGPTTINNAGHVREGFVMKTIKESWDPVINRRILKYVGQGYHLRKEDK
jgi:RNA ligase (TIGR02306 family)